MQDVKIVQEMRDVIILNLRMTVPATKLMGNGNCGEFIANHDADFFIRPKFNESDSWYMGLVPLQGASCRRAIVPEAEGVSSCH